MKNDKTSRNIMKHFDVRTFSAVSLARFFIKSFKNHRAAAAVFGAVELQSRADAGEVHDLVARVGACNETDLVEDRQVGLLTAWVKQRVVKGNRWP